MKSIFLSLSLISLSLSASEEAQLRNLENRVSALEQRKNGGSLILPSSGANLDDDVGISLDAELLIWKAHQTGMQFAQGVASGGVTSAAPFVKPDFHFDPGLRVDFGIRPIHDDWQIDFIWTTYYTKAKKNYDDSLVPVLPLFQQVLPESVIEDSLTSSVSAIWRVNYNTIDLELARHNFLSKWLAMKPYIAIRNVWLHQKYNVVAPFSQDGSVSEDAMKSNLWAIGPRAGFELRFALGEGFYLFNNTSASILWGFFDNSQNTSSREGASRTRYPRHIDIHTSTFNVDMSLGMGWDKKFDDNHYRFCLRAAWEHHVYFDTNYFQSNAMLATFEATDTPYGNFTIEGVTVSMRFDF